MKRFIVFFCGSIFLLALYFSSNVYGYFRFKSYCSNDGGLRIYAPLQKGVGLLADSKLYATVASQIKYVDFVRFIDQDGKMYDLKYLGGSIQKNSSFKIEEADESKSTRYKWKYLNEHVKNEERLGRTAYQILDAKNEKLISSYIMYHYTFFNRDKTLLGSPTTYGCFDEPGRGAMLARWLNDFNAAFKN